MKKQKPIGKIGGLLAATLLIATAPSAFCGDATNVSKSADAKGAVETLPPANPLSFFDGKVVFDLQERLRVEVRNNNYDFNDHVNALTDDAWLLQRFRIGVAVKPVEWLKFYAQTQDSREFFSDRPTIPGVLGAEGNDSFDLRQAYVQIGPKWLNLTVGRQILAYGDERLVGSFDWNNIGRTFDAVKLHFEQPKFSVDAFASTVVNIYTDSFNKSDLFNGSKSQRDQVFSGVYFNTTALDFQTTDLYVLLLNQGNPLPAATPITTPVNTGLSGKRTDFVTIGTRFHGDPKKLGGFEYEGEFAFQTGHVRGLDLTAFALHGGAGYNFLDTPWKPRLWAEYSFASGDQNSKDGKIETFQNLFPTNHNFYGYMDLFSWQNMHDPELSIRVSPCSKVTAQLDGHAFWLATNQDSWYRANGATTVRPLNAKATKASTYCGSEIDFTVTYTPIKQLSFKAGYSHFFAGDYLRETGAHSDADFGYLMATLNF